MNNFRPPSFVRYMFNRVTGRRDPNALDYGFLITAGIALAVVLMLWWTPILWPFRIFTTVVHEASHAVVGIITGGHLAPGGAIKIYWNGGGVTYFTNAGIDILTYSAGYLGSTLFGGFLLVTAKKASTRRHVLAYITIGLVVLTALFVRDPQSFLLIGIVVVLTGGIAWKGPDIVVMFYLFVMAILNVTYAIFDLFGLLMASTNPFEQFYDGNRLIGGNDASFLAARTGVPAIVWAVVWSIVGVIILWQFLKTAIRMGNASSRPLLTGAFGRKSAADKAQSVFDRMMK